MKLKVQTGSVINFWNDKWCSTIFLTNIAGYLMVLPFRIQSLSFGQFWTGFLIISWLGRNRIFLIGLQMNLVVSLLNQLGLFSQNQKFLVLGVISFDLHLFRLPKLQYSGKFFMDGFLHINIFIIKVYIYVLCVLFVKSMRNIFSIHFLNVLMLCIFGVRFGRFFLLLITLMRIIFFLLLRMMEVLWLY